MTFRTWLGSSSISEDMWITIMEEDEHFDYTTKGVGREVASEVEVYSDDHQQPFVECNSYQDLDA